MPKQKKNKDNDNKIIISSNEIKEYFELSKLEMLNSLFYSLKERADLSDTGIFRNQNHMAMSDFFDLITNNVDITSYYKSNNKL